MIVVDDTQLFKKVGGFQGRQDAQEQVTDVHSARGRGTEPEASYCLWLAYMTRTPVHRSRRANTYISRQTMGVITKDALKRRILRGRFHSYPTSKGMSPG